MLTFIAVVHVIVAVLIIFFVLLQDSKGGAMGVLGGGGGGSALFGATGAGGFLVKATTYAAIIFAGTCVYLAMQANRNDPSLLDGYVPPTQTSTEATSTPGADKKTETAPTNSEKESTKETK